MGLTHCGLVTSYGDTEDLGQYWLSNGLLPGGTKPLPASMMSYYH